MCADSNSTRFESHNQVNPAFYMVDGTLWMADHATPIDALRLIKDMLGRVHKLSKCYPGPVEASYAVCELALKAAQRTDARGEGTGE